MNLARIEIENFKQYVQPVVIEVPRESVIGIIGSNGAGKTTLFQAIEWCLYAPRAIASADIRPRGKSGKPKVAVTLESADGATRWHIERELPRSGSAQAKLYQIDADGNETIIVQGPRDVTSYVANHLIGLPHEAFVATFFTRQKELHFFGDLKDTDRRREVGKLLGLETIQRAHIAIGELRTDAVNRARGLKAQVEGELESRDLEAERTELSRILEDSQTNVAAAADREQAAELQSVTKRSQRDLELSRRDQDRDLRAQIERIQIDERNHRRRLQQREEEIQHLNQIRTEREQLVPVAASLPAIERELSEAEAQRARFENRQRLQQQLSDIQRQQASVEAQAHQILLQVGSDDASASSGRRIEEDAPLAKQVESWRTTLQEQPLSQLEQRREQTAQAVNVHRELEQAKQRYSSSVDLQTSLSNEQAELLKSGDPREEITNLQQVLTQLSGEDSAWQSQRSALQHEIDRRERILGSIQQANFDEGCPTCGRPFSEHDAEDVSHIFLEDISGYRDLIRTGDEAQQQRSRQREQTQATIAALQQTRQAIDVLQGRIEKSVGVLDHQRSQIDELSQRLGQILQSLGQSESPSNADVERLDLEIKRSRKLADAISRIDVLSQSQLDLRDRAAQVEQQLAAVADAAFEEGPYQELRTRRDEVTQSITRIEGFDQQLLRFDQVKADRDELQQSISQAAALITDLRDQVFGIGHDPEVLNVLVQEVADCDTQVALATRAHRDAELAHQEQTLRMETLDRDIEQRKSILARAEQAQRNADELTEMYNIFRQFDQWVVTKLTPQLGNLTSELVETVTDGKYTDVSFDQNFGVMVRDGDDNPFPLSTFSGGERDAISLCARLALSQMIGQQAHDPTSFLVLDEVFGSLDRERRIRLLELFGTISSTSDHFQQLFIISHVDDVRTAPTLDELWLIEESGEGISTWQRLESGDDIGEF